MNKQQGRELFRRMVKETNLVVVPDPLVDLFLTGGLEKTNDLLKYHKTHDVTGVTLVAGQQDYTLPAACVQLLRVEWNGKPLDETDEDELRNNNELWRQIPAGHPERYFLFAGRTITFIPTPNANAVVVAPNPALDYISAPADFTLNGFAQLAAMHHRIPILAACIDWHVAVNEDLAAAKGFMEVFDRRVAAAVEVYTQRMLRKD
jgi:hypothetical protein